MQGLREFWIVIQPCAVESARISPSTKNWQLPPTTNRHVDGVGRLHERVPNDEFISNPNRNTLNRHYGKLERPKNVPSVEPKELQMGATNTGECKTDSNNEGSSGMVRGAGSLLGEGEKWKVPSLCEENVLRSVGSHGSADRGVAGRGNGKQPSRKRCLSVKLDGQQVDPDKGPGPSSQLSSNIVNIKPGRLRYENKFCIGHDGGMATLTLHCEAKIDGTCKINSKALGKGDKQILEVGDRVSGRQIPTTCCSICVYVAGTGAPLMH